MKININVTTMSTRCHFFQPKPLKPLTLFFRHVNAMSLRCQRLLYTFHIHELIALLRSKNKELINTIPPQPPERKTKQASAEPN